MTTYQDFLSSKLAKVVPSGFTPSSLPDFLFDYQSHIVNIALVKGRFAIFANTGLGKTAMQLAWANAVYQHTKRPVLILAPLAVAKQTASDEANKFGISVKYCESQDDVVNGINITNYEKLGKFDCDSFVGVVLDECFTPDTLIDCLDDQNNLFQKRIDEIEVGDKILNASGIDLVSDVHRRKIDYAIKVTINGKSIICSPNHPFFTQHGWVGAQDLTPDHQVMATTTAMRMVRKGVHCEVRSSSKDSFLRSVLLSEMANESTGAYSESSHKGSQEKAWEKESRVLEQWDSRSYCTIGTNQELESNVKPRNATKSLPKIEEHEAQTFRAWGQWAGIDCPTTDNEGCTWRPVGDGVCIVTGETKSRLSNLLQARLSESRSKNSYRSGWGISSESQGVGYKEGLNAGFSWVEGIEVLEQGHPELEKYRDADGSFYFYDIGATRHPSFSIHGNLVHNSSILKSFTGAIRNQIIDSFLDTPYKLACSATPSPNDHMELGNHSEFLGIMSRTEMLAQYFVHDSSDTSKWRLKGHAGNPFWAWLAEWSIMIQKPSDLGFSDDAYQLPPLVETDIKIETGIKREGELFALTATGLSEQRQIKKQTLEHRVTAIANLVNNSDEQWLVWCETNDESAALTAAIPDAVEVKGSDKDKHKETSVHDFAHGKIRVLVSKPSIFGFGLNLQNCHNIAFVSLSNSFEMTYQAIRRCYRFGQTKQVNVYYAVTDTCSAIKANMERKSAQFQEMFNELVKHMSTHQMTATTSQKNDYTTDCVEGQNFKLYLGDCVEGVSKLPDNSIDFSVFSPPFSGLYIWSNSERDMANSRDDAEFYKHFKYLVKDLYRVIKPGRCLSFHCMDLPTQKSRDGYLGVKDLSGDLIRLFQDAGFIYQSKVTIWKDPGIAMMRTKSIVLLHKQTTKDKCIVRQGIPDYLITVRKPGENENPVSGFFTEYHGTDNDFITGEEYIDSINIWNRYASPVWMDINPSDTLQYRSAKSSEDEKHMTPLQLTVIRRALQLWSNPGDLVLDPFNGIGSTGYVALDMNRKFIGFELKKSYYDCAVKNLEYIENKPKQLSLTDLMTA